jgi:regulator of replication initiation timing
MEIMKNSEAVRQLVYVRRNLDEYLDEDRINAVNDAISALEENDKLKAEIEQLKATISKMETTTAQEDDLK